MNVRKLRRLAAKVRPEYALCLTSECADGDRTDRVKWVMENRLLKRDRDLLILYTDRQSLRQVARELECSRNCIHKRITKIRVQILDELDKLPKQ